MTRLRSEASARQAKEAPMTTSQEARVNFRQVLERVREAPLLPAQARRYIRKRLARSKAVSTLRSATALQDAGAKIGRVGIGTSLRQGFRRREALARRAGPTGGL